MHEDVAYRTFFSLQKYRAAGEKFEINSKEALEKAQLKDKVSFTNAKVGSVQPLLARAV